MSPKSNICARAAELGDEPANEKTLTERVVDREMDVRREDISRLEDALWELRDLHEKSLPGITI